MNEGTRSIKSRRIADSNMLRGIEPNPGLDWVRARTRWHERSTAEWLGIDRVYAIALPDRLSGLRAALRENRIEGRTSILDAIRMEDLDLVELVDCGVLPTLALEVPPRVAGSLWHRRRLKHGPAGRSVNRGELACTLSHLAVLLDFCESGSQQCLIFEDDIETRDLREPTRRFLAAVSDLEWDMIYLSYSHARRRDSRRLREGVWQLHGQLCCNAYLLNRVSALHLLDSHLPYSDLVDRHYRNVTEADSFVVLGPEERLFDQDRSITGSTLTQARGHLMSPQWNPSAMDKLISRCLALASPKGAAGYDERLLRHNHLPNGYLSHFAERIASVFRRST